MQDPEREWANRFTLAGLRQRTQAKTEGGTALKGVLVQRRSLPSTFFTPLLHLEALWARTTQYVAP